MSRTFLAVVMLKKWTPLWRETHLEVKMHKHFMLRSTLLKKCTLLWHEAYFEIKMFKASHVRNTFDVEMLKKVHAVVAQSTCRSQNVQNTPRSEHFWKMRCSKSLRCCDEKHIPKSKCTKHYMFPPLLYVEVSFCVAGARDFAPCQEWAKREGFVAFPKVMTGVGHSKRICKDGFRVAGTVQETFSSEMLRGQAADFLRRVAFWSIKFSGLRRWFCVTGAGFCMTWPHFFMAGAIL